MSEQDYIDFKIKLFHKEVIKRALIVSVILSFGISAMFAMPMIAQTGVFVFLLLAGISAGLIAMGTYLISDVTESKSMQFMIDLARERERARIETR